MPSPNGLVVDVHRHSGRRATTTLKKSPMSLPPTTRKRGRLYRLPRMFVFHSVYATLVIVRLKWNKKKKKKSFPCINIYRKSNPRYRRVYTHSLTGLATWRWLVRGEEEWNRIDLGPFVSYNIIAPGPYWLYVVAVSTCRFKTTGDWLRGTILVKKTLLFLIVQISTIFNAFTLYYCILHDVTAMIFLQEYLRVLIINGVNAINGLFKILWFT